MMSQCRTRPACLDPYKPHSIVWNKGMKDTDRITAAANAGVNRIGQASFCFQNLTARLQPDRLVEVAHHGRIRVRAESRSDQVVRSADIRYPVAHCLADSILG